MKQPGKEELFHFCEHFALLLHSGISPLDSLQILCDDSVSKESRSVYQTMQQDMEEYGSLAHAMKQTGAFPPEMLSYISTGEETGCLDEVMERLARHYEQENEISAQIRSAVSYPLLMLLMMGVVIVVLLTQVLPIFSQVFHQMGMEMNGVSSRLLTLGEALRAYSIFFASLAVLFVCLLAFFAFHPKGKQLRNQWIGKLPHLRLIPLYADYERLASGLSMGLRAGLTPEYSLEMAETLLTQPEIRVKIQTAQSLLREGEPFSDALIHSGLYTGMDGQLLAIGQQTGTLDQVLNQLALRAHDRFLSMIQRAISIVEPTLVIFLSLLVGLVLLSVMMPLFGVFTQMTL